MDIFFTIAQKIIKTTQIYQPFENPFKMYIEMRKNEKDSFHENYSMVFMMISTIYYMCLKKTHCLMSAKMHFIYMILQNRRFKCPNV